MIHLSALLITIFCMQSELVYCLAVVKSKELSIIGRKTAVSDHGFDLLFGEMHLLTPVDQSTAALSEP